jgi:hypothetical protein
MATMNVTSQSTDLTAYGSRLAILEVSGISTRSGQQTMRVPLNRLSQTMQQIHRQGGRIISINTGMAMPEVPKPSMEAPPTKPAPAQDNEQELKMEEPPTSPAKTPQPSNNKKKRR